MLLIKQANEDGGIETNVFWLLMRVTDVEPTVRVPGAGKGKNVSTLERVRVTGALLIEIPKAHPSSEPWILALKVVVAIIPLQSRVHVHGGGGFPGGIERVVTTSPEGNELDKLDVVVAATPKAPGGELIVSTLFVTLTVKPPRLVATGAKSAGLSTAAVIAELH
jgi:hypothetical protein